MHAYVHTFYMHVYIPTYIHTCTHTYTDRQTVRQTDSHACMHAYKHTYIHAYIHTYTQTHIQTYRPTYLRTYVHTVHTIEKCPCGARWERPVKREKKRMRTSAGMHGIRIRVDYGNGPGTQYDVSGVISLSSWLYVGLRDVERDRLDFGLSRLCSSFANCDMGGIWRVDFMKVFALSCFCQHGLSEQHLERSSCGRLVAAVHRCSGDKGYGQKAESGFWYVLDNCCEVCSCFAVDVHWVLWCAFLLLPCVSLGDWSASCCRSVLGYSIQVIGNDVSG